MPAISAISVSNVMKNDAPRFSEPSRGAEPLADEVERRPARDGSDPS